MTAKRGEEGGEEGGEGGEGGEGEEEGEREEGGKTAHIKSNNPHLTGGESDQIHVSLRLFLFEHLGELNLAAIGSGRR